MLSDIIGPPPSNPPTAAEDAVPASRAMSAIPPNLQSTAHSSTSLPSEPDSFESTTSAVADMETEQGASSRADPPSSLEPESEATLIDPLEFLMESLFPEAHGQLAADFLPVPDDDESSDGDTTSYFVEAAETYVIGSDGEEESDDGENMDDCGEEDRTVVMSNRQSSFSSFTGASLLASPRRSTFGESSVASPIEDGAVDLLSPVQLSAKLRPFSIPSMGSRVKRGDSIDSGYADGDGWGPLPFPRSPPRNFQSPVTLPSHSRRASLSSPALKAGRVSYDVGAFRPSSHNPIEVIKEVESDGSSEDHKDTAYTILGAYGTSPSEELGEGGACDPLQVIVAEAKAEEDKPSEVPAVMRSPRQYSPEHLHPTREHDLDSCNHPSFISDDNLSFMTALSTQPSYEDLSDISRTSSIKHDSLLSSSSGRSTPNTSVLSHGDANELLEQSIVGSHVCESPYLSATIGIGSQMDGTGAPEARASGECPLPEEVAAESDVLFALPGADDLRGPAPEKVVTPRGSLSSVFHFDRCSSADPSHGVSSANFGSVPLGANDLRKFAPEKVATPRERLAGAFHFNKQPPKSCTSPELSDSPHSVKDAFSSAPRGADNHRKSYAPPDTDGNDSRSPESSPTVLHGYLAECGAAETGQSLLVENSLGSDEITESFDSESDSFTQRLSFPLPPPFLPAETVEHSTLSQDEEMQRIHSAPDLTEKARPSQLPSVGSPDPDTDFTSRRSRAASDVTVKGKSPPGDTPDRSPPPPREQPGRSDSVQSLYDQYFDDGTSDDGSEFSSPAHMDTTLPDMSSSIEKLSQEVHLPSLDLTPHVFQGVSSGSDGEPGNAGADSPRSKTVLRPLLTGRRSFLRSSPAELIPKANLANDKESSPPTHPSTRLQAREIGSTMVPLGFRRHKPQVCAQPSLNVPQTHLPLAYGDTIVTKSITATAYCAPCVRAPTAITHSNRSNERGKFAARVFFCKPRFLYSTVAIACESHVCPSHRRVETAPSR